MQTILSNVLFLALMVGLWAGVTAAYMPGTVLIETVAVAALTGSLFSMARRPGTYWPAVLLIIVGVLGFLTLPLLRNRLKRIVPVGLLFQTSGAALMFQNGTVPVSWLMILGTAAASLALYRFVLLPARASQTLPVVMNDEASLPGSIGKVVMSLTPAGTVNIRGELWSAWSEQPAYTGDEVIVLAKDGLKLQVEKVKSKRIPENSQKEGKTL